MSAIITATNPAELRQEVEGLLKSGMPVGGAPLLAITGVEPDFEYFQSCSEPACAAQTTGWNCQPRLNAKCRTASLTVQGLDTQWTSRGATGVRARQWDPESPMGTTSLSDWQYDSATAAAQTIGFELTKGAHTSVRGQEFWISGDLLVVITSSNTHGEVLHTIEPICPRNRQERRTKRRGSGRGTR